MVFIHCPGTLEEPHISPSGYVTKIEDGVSGNQACLVLADARQRSASGAHCGVILHYTLMVSPGGFGVLLVTLDHMYNSDLSHVYNKAG